MKQIHAIVWKEDKLFVAKALEVEVVSQGKTETAALKNLKEALELYFEDKKGEELVSLSDPKLQEVPIQIYT